MADLVLMDRWNSRDTSVSFANWWNETSIQRDYYQAQSNRGPIWVYRELETGRLVYPWYLLAIEKSPTVFQNQFSFRADDSISRYALEHPLIRRPHIVEIVEG